MNEINPSDLPHRVAALDLANGRDWLQAAEKAYSEGDTARAHAAAIIGNGYTSLAHVVRAAASMDETAEVRKSLLSLADEPLTAEEEHRRRQEQAATEARPHDVAIPLPCNCDYAPAFGQLHRPSCPAYVAPRGEADRG